MAGPSWSQRALRNKPKPIGMSVITAIGIMICPGETEVNPMAPVNKYRPSPVHSGKVMKAIRFDRVVKGESTTFMPCKHFLLNSLHHCSQSRSGYPQMRTAQFRPAAASEGTLLLENSRRWVYKTEVWQTSVLDPNKKAAQLGGFLQRRRPDSNR